MQPRKTKPTGKPIVLKKRSPSPYVVQIPPHPIYNRGNYFYDSDDPELFDFEYKTVALRRVPPKWIEYPKYGDVFNKIFVPMKSPLSKVFDDQLTFFQRFHVEDILRAQFEVYGMSTHVKMIVNLCNHEKFYEPVIAERAGIKYAWIPMGTRDKPPTHAELIKFIDIVVAYRIQNPKHLIAVHSTYGIDRTGFVLIAYCVTQIGLTIRDMIQEFARARPGGVMRKSFLITLIERYSHCV